MFDRESTDVTTEEWLNFTLEYCSIEGLEHLLNAFEKLSHRLQFLILFFMQQTCGGQHAQVLSQFLFGHEMQGKMVIEDPAIKTELCITLRKIADQRHTLWLLERIQNQVTPDQMILMMKTLNQVTLDQLLKFFECYQLYSPHLRDLYEKDFISAWLKIAHNNKLDHSLTELAKDRKKFRDLMFQSRISSKSNLFMKTIDAIDELSNEYQNQIMTELNQKNFDLRNLLLLLNEKVDFGKVIMLYLNSMNPETARKFNHNLAEFLDLKIKVVIWHEAFVKAVFNFDDHVLEDQYIKNIEVETNKPLDKRDTATLVNSLLLLLSRKKIINNNFEAKIQKLLLPFIEYTDDYTSILLDYLKRASIEPNTDLIRAVIKRAGKKTLIQLFYCICDLIEPDTFSQNLLDVLDTCVSERLEMELIGAERSILLYYSLYRQDDASASQWLQNMLQSDDEDIGISALEALRIYKKELPKQILKMVNDIWLSSHLSHNLRRRAAAVLYSSVSKSNFSVESLLKGVNTMSTIFFLEGVLLTDPMEKEFEVFISKFEEKNPVIRCFIFNNLKRFRGLNVTSQQITKIIKYLDSGQLQRFDIVVFLLNNQCQINSLKEKIFDSFYHANTAQDRIILGWIIKKYYPPSPELKGFIDSITADLIEDDEKFNELYLNSYMVKFDTKVIQNLKTIDNPAVQQLLMKNMSDQPPENKFNTLLTGLRLSASTTYKRWISLINRRLEPMALVPLINTIDLENSIKSELMIPLFMSFPVTFLKESLNNLRKEQLVATNEKLMINQIDWILEKINI